jgi:peroxiredoxin
MKRIFYLFVALAIIAGCTSEPHFVVKADLQGSDSLTFYLQKRGQGKLITIDSAVSKKGSFKMTGTIEYPEMVQLVVLNTPIRTSFFLENAEITITGKVDSIADVKITGSKTQDEFAAFRNSNKPMNDKYSALVQEYQAARAANDEAKIAQLEKDAEVISEEMTSLQKEFIKNNPSSYLTPSLLQGLSIKMEAEEIETAINALDTNIAKVPLMQDLKKRVIAMKTVTVGQKAPDFTLNDVDGNPVALYSKVGSKLLLVDFWAAWCGPCRQENPNVVKVYNEFHKKGFDVFGVSLDRTKDDWVKAIADDKLTWTHVSDLQYWSNAAAKLYAVNSIPANFLLDETGTIIARNLREEALYEKVKEILGGK